MIPSALAPTRPRTPCLRALAALGLSLSMALAGCGQDATPPTAKPALTVTPVQPRTERLPDRITAPGSIVAWQEAVVGAEISGLRIAALRADVGDRVRRGQVLAVLASDTVEAELAAAQAALAEATAGQGEAAAAFDEARSNAARAQQVAPSGALSAQQIEQYRTAAQTAQARLASAEARVQSAQAQLRTQRLRQSMTEVRAPDEGVIATRQATLGAVVPAGQELFRLIRQGRLEWRGEVSAGELGRLAPGQSVTLKTADGRSLQGRVRLIEPVIDTSTRIARVRVDVPAPGNTRVGTFAQGSIELGQRDALTVPQSAVVLRDGFAYVFRIETDRVVQQKVTLGRREADRVEVLEGLTAQAALVSEGGGFLNDGDRVQVLSSPQAGTPAPTEANR